MEVENVFFNKKDYNRSKSLGNGSYGSVLIVNKKGDGQKYVAKEIYTDNNNNFDGNDQMLFLQESLKFLKSKHPAICKFIGINFISFTNTENFQPTIMTEFLPNGSLKNNLDKEEDGLIDNDWTPTKKYITLLGISDAMRYLHEQNIIHGNLKPENVRFDSYYNPKICDFGLSKCFPKLSKKSTKKNHKRLIWMPSLFTTRDS